MQDLLRFRGSLLNKRKNIVSPYDLSKKNIKGDTTILNIDYIYNASRTPLSFDYKNIENLNVINGMGVTLGDSVVGLSILSLIKKINPDIKISIIRPENSPQYVNEIYDMADGILDHVYYMPYNLNALNSSELNIDVGNQLFWPEFHSMEMHDFFMKMLGVKESDIIKSVMNNSWLKNVVLNNVLKDDYVLFAPESSAKVRSIPQKYHIQIINELYDEFGVNVCGFVDVEHKNYMNISALSRSTLDFVSIISNAMFLYTCDSSALHIAAGFNVPTRCVFNTIAPQLRDKYYPYCESIYIGNKFLRLIQGSEDERILSLVEEIYRDYFYG
ncbi:glycosyltransferase family 9 protein [Enterobacter asburiae]|uniref:glycosyltransferase family 9 protein n=1 Tax=Enterobacter asburiae TaxID=61645 RepID=UPI003F432412